MNIDDLIIGEAKELAAMFGGETGKSKIANHMIGKMCIVRTYSAGVWYGKLSEKDGKEVVLQDARRMWRWHTVRSISLSSVAVNGIDQAKSRIAVSVPSVWLEAIEIIPCCLLAVVSIGDAPEAARD